MSQVLGIILILFGGYVVVMNGLGPFLTFWRGRHESPVPLFGGLILAIGLYQFEAVGNLAWLAFVVDYGTMGLIIAAPLLIREFWQISRLNLVHHFEYSATDRTVEIRLYRRNYAVIDFNIDPAALDESDEALPCGGSRTGRWQTSNTGFSIQLEDADGPIELVESNGTWRSSAIPDSTTWSISPFKLAPAEWIRKK